MFLKFLKLMVLAILLVNISLLNGDDYFEFERELEEQSYPRKSAALAIVLSSIAPGTGQYYVKGFNLQSLLFLSLEIGLWTGYSVFNNKGRNMERDYEKFADKHYFREYQLEVQESLIAASTGTIYTDEFFRLDDTNTQHYYEDIGKYNKYIFGWEDWYDIYFLNGVQWAFEGEGADQIWVGNYKPGSSEFDAPYSALRQKYIVMRQDAEDYYSIRNNISFGFALNRIVSTILTVKEVNRHNRQAPKINYGLMMNRINSNPMFSLTINF